MIIYLKGILEEGFAFNSNGKIIEPSLKFLKKVSTEKVKFNFYKTQIYIANLKSFWKQGSDSASKISFSKSFLAFLPLLIYIRHLSILLKSHLIRHSGAKCISRHSKSTQSFKVLVEHSDIQRTLLGHSGTRSLRHLEYPGTLPLRHSDAQALKALGPLGTQGT